MQTNGFWILASAVLLAASAAPARANLITDPGFESCTADFAAPPGWTIGGSADVFCDENAHTGTYDVNFFGSPSTLSQSIATIAGDNYDFSFWVGAPPATPASFTASFGSDEVLDLAIPPSSYTQENFTVTATGTSTTIEFGGQGSSGDGWNLDDVSVTDQGPAAPEPASLVLLASGLLAIAWRRRQHNETRIPHMRQNGFWILASAILLAASAVPARANLITNPGFESCTFPINTYPTGWTETGSVSCSPGTVHTGNYTAVLPTDSTLSQTITTVAGENYDFSFWLLTEISSPSSINASFGGDEVLDLVNPASFGYTLEDFSVTATGTSTTIAFSTTGSGGGSAIDDVSVTDLGPATPEPASLLLLASGLLAIAWFAHRHRTR